MVNSVLATPPGGGVRLSEVKLALMSAGTPSTASFTKDGDELTACTFIEVLTWLPCSTQMNAGDSWSTKLSVASLMVKSLVKNLSGDVPTLMLT